MAKKQPPMELLKFWPVAIAILGMIGTYYTIENRIANAEEKQTSAEKRIDKVENQQDNLYTNSVEQKVQLAQVAQKMDLMLDYLKDSKK